MSILVITGSLRAGSHTASLGRLVVERFAGAGHALRLDELAFFNQDLEPEPPRAVEQLRAQVAQAALVVVVTPEYNGVVPGLLGNALDWLSRPYGACALQGKPVVAVAASPGGRGGVRALESLTQVLSSVGADVVAATGIGTVDARLPRGASDEAIAPLLAAIESEIDAARARRAA